jgi:hypothetical protein
LETAVDYFQGVVTDFLRADRAVFVNPECLLQLDVGDTPHKGRHWYCDAVAVNFRESTIYLCEVTYSKTLSALVKRLSAWDTYWSELGAAMARDCSIPASWAIQPWLFIPQALQATLEKKLAPILAADRPGPRMPKPKVTFPEAVTPWTYRTWDRKADALETAAAEA